MGCRPASTSRSVVRSSPLIKRFADLPVTEFGPKRLKQVRDDMIKLDWSRRYCNKATAIIKRCFAWAAEEELIPAEVVQRADSGQGAQEGAYRSQGEGSDRSGRRRARRRHPAQGLETGRRRAADHATDRHAAGRSAEHDGRGDRPDRPVMLDLSSRAPQDRPQGQVARGRSSGRRLKSIILPRMLEGRRERRHLPDHAQQSADGGSAGLRSGGGPSLRAEPNSAHCRDRGPGSKSGSRPLKCSWGTPRPNTTEIYAERDMSKAQDVRAQDRVILVF